MKHRRTTILQLAVLILLGAALAAGLIVRVVLAVSVRGFGVDMNCFEGWAERIFRNGFHFYDDWCDYPPGYILLLWPIGALRVLAEHPEVTAALVSVPYYLRPGHAGVFAHFAALAA